MVEFITGLIILFILYRLPRVFRSKRYRKRPYFPKINRTRLPKLFPSKKYTKRPYFRKIKKTYSSNEIGEIGETLVLKELKSFEKQSGRLLSNLYIPKPNDETTEIDVVLIHPRGFFVIESKNYSGWIFGNERNQYWTQTLPIGQGDEKSNKERFYNPLRQNGSHIKHLKRVLSDRVPMWSVIVFSDECTLKDVTVSQNKRDKVIQLHNLKSLVFQLIKETDEELFSESDIQWMYDELFPFTQVDEETKRRHIDFNSTT
jgi:hypothetical protein|tara:strand:- start:1345 stop:2121 length:777 start_codon:yes stop_codon:yes gene_type:complete